MANIFVSYSRQDLALARKVVVWLEEKGHHVWMDKKMILGGANYREEIADGIGSADIFIPLLSPHSVTSKWVKKEIYYADDKNKFFIPVLIDFVKIPEDLKFALAGIHYIDLTNTESGYDPWAELERVLLEFKTAAHEKKQENQHPSSYRAIQDFIEKKIRKKIQIKVGTLIATLLVFIGIGVFLDMYFIRNRLPDPANIQAPGVSTEVQDAIRLIYTTPLEQATPSAAVAVMIQKNKGDNSSWRLLHDGEELSSNDNYIFAFKPDEDAFFYIFQIDSLGKLDWIFPRNPYLIHSTGQNPVSAGTWVKIPEGNEAFYLDEHMGIEHFYIIATKNRWQALEETLGKASQSGGMGKPILAAFSLKTRGVAGARKVNIELPQNIGITSESVQQLVRGKAGALVIERWFNHVGRTKEQ